MRSKADRTKPDFTWMDTAVLIKSSVMDKAFLLKHSFDLSIQNCASSASNKKVIKVRFTGSKKSHKKG